MSEEIKVLTMAEFAAKGETPEILFWVGCAGSFDDRAKKITKAFVKILNHVKMSFAVLGTEETCTGDPAKRAGNEFLFQMQAMMNIQVMNGYGVKKIVTACPHCYNTLKNEYALLGGHYEVIHHSQLLEKLIATGKLKVKGDKYKGKTITFHDPCYLGRGNNIYEAPRKLIEQIHTNIKEMNRCKENGFCCGAGGAQMFKESEKGNKEIYIERTEEALSLQPDIIATGCPFCMTMLTDGVKYFEKENEVKVLDLAELLEIE